MTELHKLGIETATINGDNKAVDEELGIDRVFAEVLPGQSSAQFHGCGLQHDGAFCALSSTS